MPTEDQPDTSDLARRIVDQLQGRGVRKIILFGSRVWADPHADSDLDVLVVLKGGEDPQTSAEKGELYRRVSKPLRDLQREWPLDLLVHSEGMHRQFRERGSAFARKVLEKGTVIYGDGS
jgi:predicted nucleotidyltransferase